MEKTGASEKFLIFGHDRAVAELWLRRFGQRVKMVTFYFLDEQGRLEILPPIG